MLSQITLLALATSAFALQITSPSKDALWDLSKDNKIVWNAVNTDPQTFDIYLSHMNTQPSSNTLLQANANKDTGSFEVKNLQLPTGTTYTINFVAHDKPEQIYAQSQQFNITGEGIAATSTLDGYTGPTFVASSGGATVKTSSSDAATTTGSVTRTTLRTLTTTSGSATIVQTSSATVTEAVSAGVNGTATRAAGTATPSPTKASSAVVGQGASAPLAVLVLGVAAFFL